MVLDIRGSRKNTKVNLNPYVTIDELLSNAIDSFLIRKSKDTTVDHMCVDFFIDIIQNSLYCDENTLKIVCVDNGSGFEDEQVKAFLTKDTSYKDDLPINGIGKCKGSGRIQFFHYFSKIVIESGFQRNGEFIKRLLGPVMA